MGALKSPRCHNGHKMAGKNLYLRKGGGRECRACAKQRALARKRRLKAVAV